MELVEGEPLSKKMKAGALPVGEALSIGRDIAAALEVAHAKGIVHRDLKPGNVMVSSDGRVKLLDFGLAKAFDKGASSEDLSHSPTMTDAGTRTGVVLGTAAYMSPEQARGQPVDARTDLWAFGVVLWELLTGRRLFRGQSTPDTLASVLRDPVDLKALPLSTPREVRELLGRCLERDPEKRLSEASEACHVLALAAAGRVGARLLSRNTWIALVAAGLVAIAAAGWLWQHVSRRRWARETAAPEIARLLDADEMTKAAALAREARDVLPNDPTLEKLWIRATGEVTVESDPSGADVSIRPYRADQNAWETLGRAPLSKFRYPGGSYLLRATLPGYIPAYRICTFQFLGPSPVSFQLDREGSVPSEMVRIPAGKTGLTAPSLPGLNNLPAIELDDFLMDRTEVTNAEYKAFVDAGGYQKQEFWKQPFIKDGRTLSWGEAIALFHDTSGRPGPAGWELGQFPAGQERHPVAGVSWYEAAAYAEFVGKSLPSVYHWCLAAALWDSGVFVPGSNFSGSGTVPVGGAGAMNKYGTYDMAGNVKEWCWNERTDHLRFILGGGFGEPTYMFGAKDAQPPWRRAPNFGFRCVKLASKPPGAALATLAEPRARDYSKEKPASDESFRAYKSFYAYDKRDLAVHLDATEESDDWTTEIVSFDAGYGNERMIAYLCLPKNGRPPYQTVVYFPGSAAIHANKKLELLANEGYAAVVPKSGRALLYPIYKGTFQRSDDFTYFTGNQSLSSSYRDRLIEWTKDLSRSIDFLETRPDIDREKLAYLGFSWGAEVAPVMLAVEGRFKAAILVSGGLDPWTTPPEAEPLNFLSRVRIPVLMLNGRYDHRNPVEAAQLPFFRSLGTLEKDKKLVIYDRAKPAPEGLHSRESRLAGQVPWPGEKVGDGARGAIGTVGGAGG